MSRWNLPCTDLSFPLTVVALAALLASAGAQAAPRATAPNGHVARAAVQASRLRPQLATLPLQFEANRGQTDARAQFLARSTGAVVFLTAQGAVVKTTAGAVRLNFAGAHAVQGQGQQAAGTAVNYLTGPRSQWHRGVPSFRQVHYVAIYPGVDVVYYGNRGQLEYDLRLAPGASPQQIQLAVAGTRPRLAAKGALQLGPGLAFQAPVAYQTVQGRRRAVAVRYEVRGRNVGFQLGAYDPSQALVIDPVLQFATVLGGTGYNQANAVAVDSSDAGYIAGYTLSADFPTVSPLQASLAAGTFGPAYDAFIAKIAPDGTALVYSTYLGGSGDDEATGIAVDSTGAAYVTGFTSSTDFPTASPLQASNGGGYDAFVVKLNPAGSALVYSTYLGGSEDDKAAAIALDGSGDAFITGTTSSANFPTTAGAPQATFGGAQDAFVTALNPAGGALLYSTYLGGSAVDRGTGIAVDQTGNAYVSGATASTDFPATTGAFQTSNAGNYDAFVAKVDRSGRSFGYVTYLGGSKSDEANAIAVDAAGHAFVAGDTASINLFPASSSAFQQSYAGGTSDAFVAELNNSGSALVYGSYLGGSQSDVATAIAVDASDNAYLAGYTTSIDFPTTSNATQINSGGVEDAFLSKFDSVGQKLLFSTYFGGLSNDAVQGIGLNQATGNLFIVGVTESPNFPVTSGVVQTTVNSQNDAFAAKFVAAPQGVFSPTALGFAAQAATVASAAEPVIFTNGGEKPLTITGITTTGPYTETDNCNANSSTLQPTGFCTLNVTFNPGAAGSQNGTLVISDNAPGGSQTLPLSGSGGDFSLSVSPTSITIAAGSSASFGLNVTPAIGYTQVVALTCTGTPAESTCVPSPTSLTMNGSTTATATYTVTTTVRPSAVPPLPVIPRGPWTWLALLALSLTAALLLYVARRQWGPTRRLGWLATALLVGSAAVAFGCGGTSTNPGTLAGNYTLTFTGTAGSVTHNQTVTLTVD